MGKLKLTNEWWTAPAQSEDGRVILVTGRRDMEPAMATGAYNYRVEITWRYEGDASGMPDKATSTLMGQVHDALSQAFDRDPTAQFEEVWEKVAVEFPDICFAADTPEELAEKIGVPVKNLVKTVSRYNQVCGENYDDDFGKPHRYLRPLEGRLYAYRVICGAYGSLGGIKIDHDFRVVTQDAEPIPGLYGAGSDVCDIYNGTYYFYLPGNTMGFAVNSGRIAGENACRYALGYDD